MLVTQNDKSSTNKKENLVGTKSQRTPFGANAWDEPLAALSPPPAKTRLRGFPPSVKAEPFCQHRQT